jgi:zinc transporter
VISPPLARLGLIWGYDVTPQGLVRLDESALNAPPAEGALRWVHLNLADQRARRWLADRSDLPEDAREALLSGDTHQRALIEDGVVACTFHDLQRDFAEVESARMSAVRLLLTPSLIVSARLHPVYAADLVKRRIEGGVAVGSREAALDLLLGAILEIAAGSVVELTATVQRAEDMLLDHGSPPDQRTLAAVRGRTVLLSRQLGGLRTVLQRLEESEDLPEDLLPAVVKQSQRAASLWADVAALQSNLRQLREELDLQQAQRTNQNLYVLSILSALLLPATLVTGIFGMNTRGLPFAGSPAGGAMAVFLAFAAAFGVYIWLRRHGFFRR